MRKLIWLITISSILVLLIVVRLAVVPLTLKKLTESEPWKIRVTSVVTGKGETRIEPGYVIWRGIAPAGAVTSISARELKHKGEGIFNYAVNDVFLEYQKMEQKEGYAPAPPVVFKVAAIEGTEAIGILEQAAKSIDAFEQENAEMILLSSLIGKHEAPHEILLLVTDNQHRLNNAALLMGIIDGLLIACVLCLVSWLIVFLHGKGHQHSGAPTEP